MRRFLAIFLAFFALLPHPALLAVAMATAPACETSGECKTACPCCRAGHCSCMGKNETPAPPPSVPVRGAEFYPVPALPPGELVSVPVVSPVRQERALCGDGAAAKMHARRVSLFVQHCAWLM